jgi:hypothetical protein
MGVLTSEVCYSSVRVGRETVKCVWTGERVGERRKKKN